MKALISGLNKKSTGKGAFHVRKTYKGSTTIELALMMPILLLVITGVIHTGFYYHDKSVIYGKVYELGAIGKQQVRTEGALDKERLIDHFHQITNEKLLIFTEVECQIEEQGDGIRVSVRAERGFMSISIERAYMYMHPEDLIRQLMPVQ